MAKLSKSTSHVQCVTIYQMTSHQMKVDVEIQCTTKSLTHVAVQVQLVLCVSPACFIKKLDIAR